MCRGAKLWILVSSWLVATGWVLSAFSAMNQTGYLLSLAIGGVAGAVALAKNGGFDLVAWQRELQRLPRRFRRPAPRLFLLLAVLTLAGGLLYRDNNGDSDSYRIPRVLHWLAAGQWHWIRTLHPLMNISECNFSLLSTPLMLFTHTDRLIFLLNWIPFLLLPGLVFSFLKSLGVRARVAWWWMWILSSGWGFVFQANSTANDSFAAIFVLAGVVLALQARAEGRTDKALLALIAISFTTGIKLTNLPFGLLWLVIMVPAWRLLLRRPLLTLGAVALSLLVSFVPITVTNLQHTGTWSGLTKDSPIHATELHSPFWGIIGNTFCLTTQNLMPPFFPQADQWNAMMDRFVQSPAGAPFRDFTHFGVLGRDCHSVNESNAGIGAGVCLLTAISLMAAWRLRPNRAAAAPFHPPGRWLRLVPWLLLLIFMAKVGTVQSARHLTPYYITLFPLLLCRAGIPELARQRWWQLAVNLLLVVALSLVILNRDRPLFPALTLSQALAREFPEAKFPHQLAKSFGSQLGQTRLQTFLSTNLPATEAKVGYAAFMEADEPMLWQPWGIHTVERILPTDQPADWRAAGLHYIVLESYYLKEIRQDLADWLKAHDCILVADCAKNASPTDTSHLYVTRLAGPGD